jgi:hypothetical protein
VDGGDQQQHRNGDEPDSPHPAAQAGLSVVRYPGMRGLDVTMRGMGTVGVPAQDAAHNQND